MKAKNYLNAHEFPRNYEKNRRPSMTVPDQTMSIREIVDRYAKGLPVTANQRIPIWDGEDNDLPDPRTLDLAERQALAEQYKQELNDYRKRAHAPKQSAPTGPLLPTENSMVQAGPPIS